MDAQPPPETGLPQGARVRFHVEDAGLQVSTPVDWSAGVDEEGAIVAFHAPHPEGTPFVSSLTIVARPRDPADPTGDDVSEQAAALLALDDAHLLESEAAIVGGRPATWALVAYNDGEFELTLEQWIVADRARVVAFTATVLTFDYGYDADLYEDIVDSVVFDG